MNRKRYRFISCTVAAAIGLSACGCSDYQNEKAGASEAQAADTGGAGISWERSEDASTEPKDQEPAAAELSEAGSREWYEGGTLHAESVAAWRGATDMNRLATSADIVMKVGGYTSIPSDLKSRAADMQSCISEAVADGSVDQMKVSEIAAACAVMLGY